MKILLYHRKKAEERERSVTDRAAGRARRLRRTVWWDIGQLLLLLSAGTAVLWYAPVLRRFRLLAWLVPVNASIWEQMKPLFWLTALWTLLRRLCTGRLQRGLLTTCAGALCSAMVWYIGGSYVLPGVWGTEIPFLHLFLFCLNSGWMVLNIRLNAEHQRHGDVWGAAVLLLLAGCFIWCTGHPPGIGLFLSI